MRHDEQQAGLPLRAATGMSRRTARIASVRERLTAALIWCVAVVVLGLLGWILVDVIVRGADGWSLSFLVAEPEDAGRAGGIGPIIISTFLVLAVTFAVSVPLSLATAIALTERADRAALDARLVRRCLDVLAAVPSIVLGLFGNAFFCVALGMGYSILAGGLTLACMVLPIMIRTTEQALAAVPDEYRLAAAGLGLNHTSTLFRVLLPAAAPAMAAGIVLGIGRALAETAVLIFTAGYVVRMPESLADSGRVMSVHIYDLAMNVPGGSAQAYTTATVLVVMLLLINTVAVALLRLAGFRHVAGGREA